MIAAHEAFSGHGLKLLPAERSKVLNRIADNMKKTLNLSETETIDNGKAAS